MDESLDIQENYRAGPRMTLLIRHVKPYESAEPSDQSVEPAELALTGVVMYCVANQTCHS